MRVPVYNEQLRYAGRQGGGRLQGGFYDGRAGNEALMQAGRALQGTAQNFGQASERLAEAEAANALTQYQKEFLAKQTEIFKLKGEQALTVAKDFEAWQQGRVEELTKNLSRFGRERFGQRAGAVFESNAQWAAKYQAVQEEVYAESVFQAGLDTERDVYLQNINDPKLMEESRQRIFESIQKYGQDKGMPQEAIKQLYKNTISKNSMAGVQLFIDSGDLPKARTLLEHNRIYFAPDEYAKMKSRIADEQERLNEKWEKQAVENTSKALFEQYADNPYEGIKALNANNTLSFEQKQKVASLFYNNLENAQKTAEIERDLAFDNFKKETAAFMADNKKTDNDKMAYIQNLPMGSDERSFANASFEWQKRGYIPTADQNEFVSKYQNTEAYKGMSRSDLGNIYKDLSAQLDGMQIFDPVERYRFMEQQMQQIEVETWGTNDIISLYEYRNKINNDPSYANKELVIPDEEREIIRQNIMFSDYETEDEREEKIQQAYRMKHGLL